MKNPCRKIYESIGEVTGSDGYADDSGKAEGFDL